MKSKVAPPECPPEADGPPVDGLDPNSASNRSKGGKFGRSFKSRRMIFGAASAGAQIGEAGRA
jgi:hypothetical protein